MPRLNRIRVPHHGRRQFQPGGELPANQFGPGGKLRHGQTTPRSVFRSHILGLLLRADGHSLPSRQIRQRIWLRLARRFTPADLSLLNPRTPRWVNSMQWERKKMVMDSLIEPTDVAGHGVWRLTLEGVREAQN
jgi:hypothetical protein